MIANQTYYLDKSGNLTTDADSGVVLVVRKGFEINADLLARFPFSEAKPKAKPQPEANKTVAPKIETKAKAKPASAKAKSKKVN